MTEAERFFAKARGCKLGTIPATVVVHGKSIVEPGRWIMVREKVGARWSHVLVTDVHPDGFFKADR